MLKVKILNISQFDVVVDTKGQDDVKDKIIIPPNVTVEAEIPNRLRHTLKEDKRIRVTITKN